MYICQDTSGEWKARKEKLFSLDKLISQTSYLKLYQNLSNEDKEWANMLF